MEELLKLDLLNYGIISEDEKRVLAINNSGYYDVDITRIEEILLFSTKEIAENHIKYLIEVVKLRFLLSGAKVVKVVQSFKVYKE